MGRLVMKFGGTSVANIDRIRNVARHVKREVDAGHDVAVVVSAMSGKTNELVEWCRDASPMHDAREYDAVVASGEQVTSGLLAIALQAHRHPGPLLAGLADPDQDLRRPRLGADSRDRRHRDHQPFQGPQGSRRHRRLPGHQSADQPNHHARARRLGHLGGGDRGRDPCRPLRHLYRRRRRLHHRPARGSEGAAARQDRVRGHAGTGLAGRQGAAGALGGTRHGAQHADLRPFQLRQARGYRPARHRRRAR